MHHRLRKQTAQHEQCRKYAGDLRNDVKAEVYQPDLSQVEKGERNRRIHVGAGSFTEGRFDGQETTSTCRFAGAARQWQYLLHSFQGILLFVPAKLSSSAKTLTCCRC